MVRFPEFFMPFPARPLNAGMEQARQRMWAWIDHFGLGPSEASHQRLSQLRLEVITARYYPFVEPSALPLLALHMAWAWCVDEQFDDGPAGRDPRWCLTALRGLRDAVLGGSHIPGNPLEAAAADFHRRLGEVHSPRWVRDYTDVTTRWLWSYYAESLDRATDRHQPLPDYRRHRQVTSGEHMFFMLAEHGAGRELPDSVSRLPAYIALQDAAAEHMGLLNDIVSLPKEEPIGDVHNAVTLVSRHSRVPAAEAAEAVNDMLTDCVHRMLAAEDELPGQLDAVGVTERTRADALAMVEAIKAHTRGNFDWHFEVSRYAGPGQLDEAGSPAYVADVLGGARTGAD
ncbi:terpene synthase family protein [Streptomyces clavuligerus]|nr:terpene synthase family protein [Streptomyces clavuligerus]AXU17284.1 terpene cyclase [Streptomyces clavuligerus]MBY6307072.1 terpene cyclase [Streptomyces clavuligerus]QCS10353.1 terpene cyclase [Streptomyces clavuligerus]QPJ97602.1 terpene cyclase [Streptomyces clavuligerus]QPL67122.1 terpene cyclase [Streptomyces clavuligerus]